MSLFAIRTEVGYNATKITGVKVNL